MSPGRIAVTPSRHRVDIQVLRAVAVASVVLFHAGASRWLPGGFVGVDIFYVISGYLILGGVGREVVRNGRFDVLRFAARRVLRILPMLLLTILAVTVAARVWLSPLQAYQTYLSLQSAALHYANLYFANRPQGYFARDQVEPALHLWSISTEEQFYLLVMLIGLILYGIRRSGLRTWRWVIAAITLISFVLSVVLSDSSGSVYYLPWVRAWQIGVGALIGLAGLTRPPERLTGHALRVAGIALIIASVLMLSPQASYPGWRALLPTVGTALLLLAGTGTEGIPTPRVLAAPAWIGDISYSLYLLHWPVIVLAPIVFARDLSVAETAALVAGCVLLATMTYHLVEKPLMSHPIRKRQPGLVVAFGIAAFVTVAAVIALFVLRNPLSDTGADTTTSGNTPISAPTGAVPSDLKPSLVDAGSAPVFDGDCLGVMDIVQKPSCWGGDVDADKDIVLYGDSHAGHFMPAFDEIGKDRGYRVLPMVLNACPSTDIPVNRIPPEGTANPYCPKWQDATIKKINELKPALVVVSNDTRLYEGFTSSSASLSDQMATGYANLLSALPTETKLVVLSDSPVWPDNPVDCLSENLDDAAACKLPARADSDVFSAESISKLVGDRGDVIDVDEFVCADSCYATDGSTLIYQDRDHLSQVFIASITDELDSLIFEGL